MNLTLIARIILGLIFTVKGLDGFFNLLPATEWPESAGAFLGALAGTGYFFPFLKLTEIVCGLLLLSNKMVPLALTILASDVLNILLFHIFLAPAPAAIAVPVLNVILLVYLAYSYRDFFTGVLTVNATVDVEKEEVPV